MWWSAVATLLTWASLAAPAAPANTQPTWSPDGRWIAYASNRDGTFGIWKTDGVHVRRVAADGAEPAWSPDGRWIAFDDHDRIALVHPDGTGRHVVSPRKGWTPAWSPDSKRLAFVRPPVGCADGYAIDAMRVDGKPLDQLSSSSEFDGYWAPAWSPDGRSVAYVHTDGAIELERADVTRNTEEPLRGSGTRPGRPSWSPDSRLVVFADDRSSGPRAPKSVLPDGFGPMVVLDVRTGVRRRLTGMWGNRPAWSPRGKRIAFAGKAPDGSTQLYLVNADGSHLVRLT